MATRRKNHLRDAPELLQHHSVVIGTNQKFSQVNVIPNRVEKYFVALNVAGSMVPGDTETGLGRL